MNIIKEYCKYAATCVIRSNSYGSRMDKFQEFFEIAQNDFPDLNLKYSDMEIVKYGGERYARTFGIEFLVHIPEHYIPSDYVRISQLEYT